MSWDPSWEQVFQDRDWARYPSEELIRFVARHFYPVPDRGQAKFLEIGCGPGANVWYLAREGFDAHGIDGSTTAIANARLLLEREGLKAKLQVSDVISLSSIYPPASFDAVIDSACLQHNRLKAIDDMLEQVETVLKPHGRLFSLMHAVGSHGYGLGDEVEPGTFVKINEGGLRGTGLCHFSTLEEVQHLFARFEDVRIDYSVFTLDSQARYVKRWVIEGIKRQ